MANEIEIEIAKLKVRVEALKDDVAKLDDHREANTKEVREALNSIEKRVTAMEKPMKDLIDSKKAILKKMWGLLWTIITIIVLVGLGLKDK